MSNDWCVINVAKDFSKFPGGALKSSCKNSGERLREIIVSKLSCYKIVEINISGVSGYRPSFLKECFGGLVTKENFSPAELSNRLVITSCSIYDGFAPNIKKCIWNAE